MTAVPPAADPAADRPVAGYYPDPSIPGYVRYWDGLGWTPGTSRPAPAEGEELTPPRAAAAGARSGAPSMRYVPPPVPQRLLPPIDAEPDQTGPIFLDETGPVPEPRLESGARSEPGAERYRAALAAAAAVEAVAESPSAAQPQTGGGSGSRWVADATQQRGLMETGLAPRWVSWGSAAVAEAVAAAEAEDGPHTPRPRTEPTPDPAGPSPQRLSPRPPQAPGTEGPQKPAALEPSTWPEGTAQQRERPPAAPFPESQPPRSAQHRAPSPTPAPAPAQHRAPAGAGPARRHAPTGAAAPAQDPAPPTAPTPGQHRAPAGAASAQHLAPSAAAAPVQRPAPAPSHGPSPSAASAPAQDPAPSPTSAPAPRRAPSGTAAPAQHPAPSETPAPRRVVRTVTPRPALLGRRLVARLFDMVMVGGVVAVLGSPVIQRAATHMQDKIDAAGRLPGETRVWLVDPQTLGDLGLLVLLLLAVGLLYEALPTALWGRTLGKAVVGLRVLDRRSKQRPGFGGSLARWLSYQVLLLLGVGVLDLLWCMVDRPWRQCWHDKIGHTFVVSGRSGSSRDRDR